MPLTTDSAGRTYLHHANGQLTHYIHTPCTSPFSSSQNHTPLTILIQHGFARHSAFWSHWIPLLSRHYSVLQRDLRGHGYSSYPAPSPSPSPSSPQYQNYKYTTTTIISEIIDLLNALGLQSVHLLGESTGGMLCEILASTHPDRVSSLTICASPTHLPRAAVELFAFGRESWGDAVRELGARGWATELAKVPGTVPVPSNSGEDADGEAALEKYLDMISVSDGEGLAQYAEFLETLDARPYLSGITCPMLILAPTGSVAVKLKEMEEVKEKVGGRCKVVCVEGGGHEIYVTRAGVCQETFLGFLQEVDGGGGTRKE